MATPEYCYEERAGDIFWSMRDGHLFFTASHERDSKYIKVHVRQTAGDDCHEIDATIVFCLPCTEFEEFVCQLGRVNCRPHHCKPWVFDQDDCDDCDCDDKTVRITVGELRDIIKGKHVDDIIELSDE